MIRKFKWLFSIVLFIILFSSCRSIAPPPPAPALKDNFRPLTMALLKEIEKQVNGRDGKDITNIQFYLSSDVELIINKRESKFEVVTKDGGNLGEVQKKNIQKYEKIILPKESPGIFTGYPRDTDIPNGLNSKRRVIGISFEKDRPKNLLYFSQNNLNEYDYFYLQPVDYDSIMQFRDPSRDYETMLRVNYGGKDYFAAVHGPEIPYLMIKFTEINNRPIIKETTISGNKITPKI